MLKLKKTISLLMLLLMVCSVSAQAEQVTIRTQAAGILPGNILYGLDRAIERLTLALTIGKVTRAERHLSFAMERLAELEEVADEPALAEMAIEGLEESVEELELGIAPLQATERLRITERFRLHLEQFESRADTLPVAAQAGFRTAIQNQEQALVRLQTKLPAGMMQGAQGLTGAQVHISPEELQQAKKGRR